MMNIIKIVNIVLAVVLAILIIYLDVALDNKSFDIQSWGSGSRLELVIYSIILVITVLINGLGYFNENGLKHLASVAVFLSIMLMVYFIVSFVVYNFNSTQWNKSTLDAYTAITPIVSLVITFVFTCLNSD